MIYAAFPVQKKHLTDFLHFKQVDSLTEISVGMQLCDLPYWGPKLLSKCQYHLEVNSEYSQVKGIYKGKKERRDIYAQFVAGKCLEIVAGKISTPEVILLKKYNRKTILTFRNISWGWISKG